MRLFRCKIQQQSVCVLVKCDIFVIYLYYRKNSLLYMISVAYCFSLLENNIFIRRN